MCDRRGPSKGRLVPSTASRSQLRGSLRSRGGLLVTRAPISSCPTNKVEEKSRSMKNPLIALAGVALTLAATFAVVAYQHATGSGTAAAAAPAGSGSGAVVVDWNKELVKIVNTPGAQPPTIHPTRSFAILHVAIYDAVVSIEPRSEPYLFAINAPGGARPDVAAAEAGHDVLLALYPSWKAALDQQLADELATIPDGSAKLKGIAVGRLAAMLALASRANDGSNATPPAIAAGTSRRFARAGPAPRPWPETRAGPHFSARRRTRHIPEPTARSARPARRCWPDSSVIRTASASPRTSYPGW